jgi:hypothetical protein
LLVLELKLTNNSATKICNFAGWQTGQTVVQDEHGNRCGMADFGPGVARTPEEISQINRFCALLQTMFLDARHSIGEGLSLGIDAREFAAKYENAVKDLEPILRMIGLLLSDLQSKPLPHLAEERVSRFRAVMDEVLALRQFIKGAVDKAKLPPQPTDWTRIEEARQAYERGEMKPFQRLSQN